MEGLKKKYKDLTLRRAFALTVSVTFGAVILLSGLCIWGCAAFRSRLMPDSDRVSVTIKMYTEDEQWDTSISLRLGAEEEIPFLVPKNTAGEDTKEAPDSYNRHPTMGFTSLGASVEKIENSFAMLSPRRKLAYQGCGILMIVLPALFSVFGVLFSCFFFYRHKLYLPLKALSGATLRISEENLDFQITYDSADELGKLCRSFEKMRQTLDENNRRLWKMLEERKLMQASVAHDLRNPIAIISGYTEYLQINLQKGSLTMEKVGEIAGNVEEAAKRLERYTESVRALNCLEDIGIKREPVESAKLTEGIRNDLSLMAAEKGIRLNVTGTVPEETLNLDAAVLYRVLENVLNNALRYAREAVDISFERKDDFLIVSVADDGPGFSEEILKNKSHLLMPASSGEDGHCGMGLTISRLLCRRHGGRLELSNRRPCGACVKIFFGI